MYFYNLIDGYEEPILPTQERIKAMIVEAKLERKKYLKLMYLMVYRKPVIIFLTIIGIVMFIGSIAYVLGYRDLHTDPPYVPGVFGFFIVFVIPYSILRNANKNFSSNGRLQEKIVYEFTSDLIKIKGHSFTTEMDWEKIYKVLELKNWILVYQNKYIFNVIPKKSFGEHLTEFKIIIRNNKIKSKF